LVLAGGLLGITGLGLSLRFILVNVGFHNVVDFLFRGLIYAPAKSEASDLMASPWPGARRSNYYSTDPAAMGETPSMQLPNSNIQISKETPNNLYHLIPRLARSIRTTAFMASSMKSCQEHDHNAEGNRADVR
jgi:hypothetical protein